jgi:ribonuclease E
LAETTPQSAPEIQIQANNTAGSVVSAEAASSDGSTEAKAQREIEAQAAAIEEPAIPALQPAIAVTAAKEAASPEIAPAERDVTPAAPQAEADDAAKAQKQAEPVPMAAAVAEAIRPSGRAANDPRDNPKPQMQLEIVTERPVPMEGLPPAEPVIPQRGPQPRATNDPRLARSVAVASSNGESQAQLFD